MKMRRIDIVLKFTLVGRLFVRYILKSHSSVACGATQVRQNPVEVTNPKHEKYFRKKKEKKNWRGEQREWTTRSNHGKRWAGEVFQFSRTKNALRRHFIIRQRCFSFLTLSTFPHPRYTSAWTSLVPSHYPPPEKSCNSLQRHMILLNYVPPMAPRHVDELNI